MKTKIKLIQQHLGVADDGIIGNQTLDAMLGFMQISLPVATLPTEAEVRSGKSIYGKAGDESNLVSVVPPFPLYYEGDAVRSVRIHKAAASDLEGALKEILEVYGQEEITRLGFDNYSGSFDNRSVRGGTSTSMHAYGIALDFYAEKNGNSTRAPHAAFSHPDCEKFFDIWEKWNFKSLGRSIGRDWMHVQRTV